MRGAARAVALSASLACLSPLLAGCGKGEGGAEAERGAKVVPSGNTLAPSPSGSSAPPPPSASAPASASQPASSAGGGAPGASGEKLPPLSAIKPSCCMADRTTGTVGPDKGVNARYAGDYLKRRDGERLLFPDDLISDTRELYQFAKSAGKSLYQERKLKVVGEGARYVSVEIEEKGETGASQPFEHSKCATVDLRTGKKVKLDELVGKEPARAAEAEARRRFDEAPEHLQYRFVPGSFVVLEGEGGRRVRFCNPRKDEKLGGARLDVEAPLP